MTRKKTHDVEALNVQQAKDAIAEAKQKANKAHRADVNKQASLTANIELGHTAKQTWIDVVCGKEVISLDNTYTHDETVYVFCSSDCKKKFVESPASFVMPE